MKNKEFKTKTGQLIWAGFPRPTTNEDIKNIKNIKNISSNKYIKALEKIQYQDYVAQP